MYFLNNAPLEGGGVQIGGSQGAQPTVGTAEGGYEAQEPGGIFGPTTLILWGLIIVGMWMLLIRPQRKREKQVREMQAALKVGENIITTSGFYGKIVGVSEDAFQIEFGDRGGFKVWVRKSDIAGPKSPSTSAPKTEEKAIEDKKDEKDKKDK